MRRVVSLWVLFFFCVASVATAGDRRLHGQVLTVENGDHHSPMGKNIEVIISQIGTSHYTDTNGAFDYLLRDRDRPGKEITFNVKIEGYVIHDPMDGQMPIPKDSELVRRIANSRISSP